MFCRFIEFVAVTAGIPRCKIVDGYRKGNPGFMHDGYMIRLVTALSLPAPPSPPPLPLRARRPWWGASSASYPYQEASEVETPPRQ